MAHGCPGLPPVKMISTDTYKKPCGAVVSFICAGTDRP